MLIPRNTQFKLSERNLVKTFITRSLSLVLAVLLGGCGLYDQNRADYYNPPACVHVTNYDVRYNNGVRFGPTDVGYRNYSTSRGCRNCDR